MDIFCFQVIIGFYWNDVHILLHMVSIFAKFYAISLIKFVFINLALFHFAKTMATGGRGSSYFSKVNSIWACLWYPLWAIHINLLKKQDKICILETLPSTNIPWLLISTIWFTATVWKNRLCNCYRYKILGILEDWFRFAADREGGQKKREDRKKGRER